MRKQHYIMAEQIRRARELLEKDDEEEDDDDAAQHHVVDDDVDVDDEDGPVAPSGLHK